MSLIGFLLVAMIVAAVFWRAAKPVLLKPVLIALCAMVVFGIGTYIVFGKPTYNTTRKTALPDFNAVSPERSTALQTFKKLQTSGSQDATLWINTATALRVQGALSEASQALAMAARFTNSAPEKAGLLGAAGETLVERDAGKVSKEASVLFNRALSHDGASLGAHYYLGAASEEAQDEAQALFHYRAFIAAVDPSHPLRSEVNAKILSLSGAQSQSGSSVQAQSPGLAPVLTPEIMEQAAAMSPEERQAFIASMVARLQTRLDTQGGDAQEWRRLARVYLRLGEPDKARIAYDRALELMPDDEALQLERSQL